MIKTLSLLLLCAFTLCCAVVFPLGGNALEKNKPSKNNLPKEVSNSFLEQRHSLFDNDKNYSMRVNYPSFGTALVDADIATWVHQRMSFFKEGVTDLPVSNPEYSNLNIDYKVSHTSLRCISLLFTIKTQTGSPQIEEGLMTITYQAQEGRRLGLNDLFTKPEGLIPFLSQYCRRSLIFRDWLSPDSVFIYQGTTPNRLNFMFFTITPYGLDIHFPPNHIASAFEGTVTVSIPLAELEPFVPNTALWGK